MPISLVDALRAALEAHRDPERAAGQQAYMKSALPYYGIALPQVRRLVRGPLRDHPLADRAAWERAIIALWDSPVAREDWYAALVIARARPYQGWAREWASVPLYEHLVVTGAWWDVCDEIAAHLVAPLLVACPDAMRERVLAWTASDEPWLRRVAVQSQLGLRDATRPELLAATIEPHIEDPSFWMRKAIGWALRDYSTTNPAWVRTFVAHHPGLSGLSRREALRKLPQVDA